LNCKENPYWGDKNPYADTEAKTPLRFAVIGAAGYVAPRHVRAIKETGNELVAVVDPHDSVGYIDKYFPKAKYFREAIEFAAWTEGRCDWVSVCAPNYLHYDYSLLAMKAGANVLCEKPLVVLSQDLGWLQKGEIQSQRRVWTVLQLRLHPVIQELKEEYGDSEAEVEIEYSTPRGPWYWQSWKGDVKKSGGLAMNIGVHLFDMLLWVFGGVKDCRVDKAYVSAISGELELERARVKWSLSLNGDGPKRRIVVNGKEYEFSDGFEDLHTKVYEETLAGRGFGIEDVRPSVELAWRIRNTTQQ